MGITDLAIVYQDTAFGREFLADATSALMPTGKAAAPKGFKLDAEGTQVAAVVAQAIAAKPMAVLLGTAGDVTALLVNEFKKVSPSTPLAATSVALSGDNLRQLGSKTAGLALSMVLPDAGRTSVPWFANTKRPCAPLDSRNFRHAASRAM